MDSEKWPPPPSMEPDMTGTNDARALRRHLDAGTLTFSTFQTLLYLRLRRLVPFAIAHAFLDGASVLIGVLIPQLRA